MNDTLCTPAGLVASHAVERLAPPDDDPVVHETVLRPRSSWIGVDWRELHDARELLYFLVWRDLKVRYKQTVLGVAWALLQPIFMLVIFTMIFGKFAGIPSDGLPYPVFVFCGLLPWTFFSNALTAGGQSLVGQQALLTKIYLPRLLIPTAAVGVFLVDLALCFGLYAAILGWYGVVPSGRVVLLPFVVLLTVAATLGPAYLLSALTVVYRDFRFVLPFLVQILMYASPVIFPARMLSARAQLILALNPMFGIIEAYRACILGTPCNAAAVAISTAVTVVLLVLGLFYFRKIERRFADVA